MTIRSLKRADSLKLKRLVASNQLAITKFDLTHVQRSLLSFGPKASIQLKTNPTNVCKQLRASSKLIYQFDNENTVMTIDGALNTSWLKNQQKEATSLVFPEESEAKFLSVSKSGILPVNLQLLHECALHRKLSCKGHLKLAHQICNELRVLASSVTSVDMEIKIEDSLRRARTLLATNQFIRVRCSNGSGNGDPFLDDLVDIRQDIGKGNKVMIRSRGIHGGRCGSSSSATGEGDLVADELYKESSQCRRGSNIVDMPPNESSHTIWIYPYQNGDVNFFPTLLYSANMSFDALLVSLLSTAKSSYRYAGIAKQALFSISQCIVVLCLATKDYNCSSTKEEDRLEWISDISIVDIVLS
nr:anaphase-promoting complex subunit 5 isoform X1 [Tanacetum cinerariifolium]